MTALSLLRKWRAEIAANAELGLWSPTTPFAAGYDVAMDALVWARSREPSPHPLSRELCLRIYDAAIARLEDTALARETVQR